VAQVLATVRARVGRLIARRHLETADDTAPADPLAEASPVLAGLASASVQGRVALGPRAGARVWRLGDKPDLGHVISRRPRQAQLDGFDLHANVWVPPNNRKLKTIWRDGTSHFLFEPIEFLEKLAAVIPRPAVNLLLYHGVLAPACALALAGRPLRPPGP